MAQRNKASTARKSTGTTRNNREIYVEGNAARRLQEVPARQRPAASPEKRQRPEPKAERPVPQSHQLSREAQRNRARAKSMSSSFVVFLAAVSVAILFFSVHYLQLKSEITSSMKTVASLESELSQLKEDNDAYYSQVTSNVDLNNIKKIAIGRLGMNYPTEDQKMTYKTSRGSYVRQYQDIPESR
jgi:cell division protein FtsL